MNKLLTKSLQMLQGVRNIQSRYYSLQNEIKKSVFISQSRDVYTNLALEDWFYKNNDFSHHHVLMLWQNDPCVVIGRHQNPWDEVNVNRLLGKEIKLARRNSGGGTVYHDEGNLNLTFFTSKKNYDRKYNLELIVRAIFKEFGLKLTVTPKYDIMCEDYKVSFFLFVYKSYKSEKKKVSGTASKLGRNTAYHHCTLLVNVNKLDLRQVLQSRQSYITSNATKSIPSPIINLSDENSSIDVESLMSVVGWEYLRTNALTLKDEGSQYLSEQKGFQLLNPTDQWFSGLDEIRNTLKSWDWCYGKTPKFSVNRSFTIPAELVPHDLTYISQKLSVKMFITNGLIEEVFLNIPAGLLPNGPDGDIKIISNLEGRRYTEDAIKELEFSLKGVNILSDDKKQFVTKCFRKVMASI